MPAGGFPQLVGFAREWFGGFDKRHEHLRHPVWTAMVLWPRERHLCVIDQVRDVGDPESCQGRLGVGTD